MRRWALAAGAAALAAAGVAGAAAFAPKGAPHEYGRVVLDAGTRRARVPAVVFDHWRHRAQFTCRACHVDAGFAMQRGETAITAATNAKGFHCGACHDGRREHDGRAIFAACNGTRDVARSPVCGRCHGGDEGRAAAEHAALPFPRGSFGEVEWGQAGERGAVQPLDAIEGVSLPRPALKMDRDVKLDSLGSWMTDVRFSHRRHAVWNGCEVCHPEIYPSTKAGTVKFTMFQIAEGLSCGACHGKVAFPLAYCSRCHTKPVEFP